jgi:hypothetical protein
MYSLVVGPILSKMSVLDRETSDRKEEIRRDQRILTFKERILGDYMRYQTYLDSTQKSSEEIIAALLKKIETVAQQESITVKDIRPGETERKPQFQIYKTSFDCEGTLPKLLAFMNTLEQSDYLFQITKYSLAPKSKGADILKASIDIVRYLIPAEPLGAKWLSGFETSVAAEAVAPSVAEESSLPRFPDLHFENEKIEP